MRLCLALYRIVGEVILYSVVGTIICATTGIAVGIVTGFAVMILLTLLGNSMAASTLLITTILGFGSGGIGGFIAFTLAGLVRGIQREFPLKIKSPRLKFERCVEGAMSAANWCSIAGLLTGAMIGALWRDLSVFSSSRIRPIIVCAEIGWAIAYALGLIVGALAPHSVQTVKTRWYELRRYWLRQRKVVQGKEA